MVKDLESKSPAVDRQLAFSLKLLDLNLTLRSQAEGHTYHESQKEIKHILRAIDKVKESIGRFGMRKRVEVLLKSLETSLTLECGALGVSLARESCSAGHSHTHHVVPLKPKSTKQR